MKPLGWMAALAVALLLGGCITSETYEVRITLDDRGSGVYAMVFRNLQSDDEAADAQASDFDELVRMWQSDAYLLEGVSEGRYIKRRDLGIEDGVLVGREEGLFLDLVDFLDFERGPGDVIRLDTSDELVRTNGVFVPDSNWVEWPADARVLEVEMRTEDFDPHGDFVSRCNKYLRQFEEERTRK